MSIDNTPLFNSIDYNLWTSHLLPYCKPREKAALACTCKSFYLAVMRAKAPEFQAMTRLILSVLDPIQEKKQIESIQRLLDLKDLSDKALIQNPSYFDIFSKREVLESLATCKVERLKTANKVAARTGSEPATTTTISRIFLTALNMHPCFTFPSPRISDPKELEKRIYTVRNRFETACLSFKERIPIQVIIGKCLQFHHGLPEDKKNSLIADMISILTSPYVQRSILMSNIEESKQLLALISSPIDQEKPLLNIISTLIRQGKPKYIQEAQNLFKPLASKPSYEQALILIPVLSNSLKEKPQEETLREFLFLLFNQLSSLMRTHSFDPSTFFGQLVGNLDPYKLKNTPSTLLDNIVIQDSWIRRMSLLQELASQAPQEAQEKILAYLCKSLIFNLGIELTVLQQTPSKDIPPFPIVDEFIITPKIQALIDFSALPYGHAVPLTFGNTRYAYKEDSLLSIFKSLLNTLKTAQIPNSAIKNLWWETISCFAITYINDSSTGINEVIYSVRIPDLRHTVALSIINPLILVGRWDSIDVFIATLEESHFDLPSDQKELWMDVVTRLIGTKNPQGVDAAIRLYRGLPFFKEEGIFRLTDALIQTSDRDIMKYAQDLTDSLMIEAEKEFVSEAIEEPSSKKPKLSEEGDQN